jgi:hypothetical protein
MIPQLATFKAEQGEASAVLTCYRFSYLIKAAP